MKRLVPLYHKGQRRKHKPEEQNRETTGQKKQDKFSTPCSTPGQTTNNKQQKKHDKQTQHTPHTHPGQTKKEKGKEKKQKRKKTSLRTQTVPPASQESRAFATSPGRPGRTAAPPPRSMAAAAPNGPWSYPTAGRRWGWRRPP